MRRGSSRWTDPRSGVEILVSYPAEKTLGAEGNQEPKKALLVNLAKFMVNVGADRAYVSKQGKGLVVSLIWSLK